MKDAQADNSLSVPDADISYADYTPNPSRSIRVEGELNQGLLDWLEPKILALTSQSSDPITVFINSDGGSNVVGQRILSLLSPCPTITVACRSAKSAAADLLSAGDWAIARPDSRLLYHGTTIPTSEPLTAEWVSLLSASLKSSNGKAIAVLARQSVRRFRFILSALRAADVESLEVVLSEKLSANGQKVLSRGIAKWEISAGLLRGFQEEIGRACPTTRAEFEKAMVNAAFQFEWQHTFDSNKTLNNIANNFAFLEICFQEDPTRGELRVDPGQESWEWPFFVGLCCGLQEGQNELTAIDALFLGLVDTVTPQCS